MAPRLRSRVAAGKTVRIAIIGTGGVGGYFGARLAAAGEDVVFLARGPHLEAIRRHGIVVSSALGDARVFPAKASDDPGSLGTAALVIVAVKNWDTEGAGAAAARLRAPGGEIVSFQNGVEAWDALARIAGDPILGGVAYITASIESPGVIRHAGMIQRLAIGDFSGRRSETAERFVAACRRAGVDAAIPADIRHAIWEKFVFLTAFSAMTALARLPIGPIRASPGARSLLERGMQEAADVGRARGAPLAPDAAARQLALADRLPADAVSSMLHDLTRGGRLEVAWLSGAVVRMGRELGIATPVHELASAVLELHADGAAPRSSTPPAS